MGKIYWTSEVKHIMDARISGLMNGLLNDKDSTNEQIVYILTNIRNIRQFADDIIAEMEEMDRKEDEERKGAAE